jgi:hypothetical protein
VIGRLQARTDLWFLSDGIVIFNRTSKGLALGVDTVISNAPPAAIPTGWGNQRHPRELGSLGR